MDGGLIMGSCGEYSDRPRLFERCITHRIFPQQKTDRSVLVNGLKKSIATFSQGRRLNKRKGGEPTSLCISHNQVNYLEVGVGRPCGGQDRTLSLLQVSHDLQPQPSVPADDQAVSRERRYGSLVGGGGRHSSALIPTGERKELGVRTAIDHVGYLGNALNRARSQSRQ